MKEDKLFKLLREKMLLVSSVSPQEIGPFTPYWRRVVPFVKGTPVRILFLTGFASSVILWFILGPALVKLVNILQIGF